MIATALHVIGVGFCIVVLVVGGSLAVGVVLAVLRTILAVPLFLVRNATTAKPSVSIKQPDIHSPEWNAGPGIEWQALLGFAVVPGLIGGLGLVLYLAFA